MKVTITIPRMHWKWGLLGLLVLALTLTWGHSASDTAQAVGPEMSLTAANGPGETGLKSCDTQPKPTKCNVTVGEQFDVLVEANVIPAGGYIGFQTEVNLGGLVYKEKLICQDDVVWPNSGFCVRAQNPPWIAHGAQTSILPPFPVSFHVGTLLKLNARCDTLGQFKLSLASTGGGLKEGTSFLDVNGLPVAVKGAPEADSLLINCVAGVSLDEQINIEKVDKADQGVHLPGSCWLVSVEHLAGQPPVLVNKPVDVVSDNNSKALCDDIGPIKGDLFDKDPADGFLGITIPGALRAQYGDDWGVQEIQPPPGYEINDPTKYECDLSEGKCNLVIKNQVLASEINIGKTSRVDPQPVRGSCFDVLEDSEQVPLLFTVCDNDFQAGFPQSHPLCEVDNTPECEDNDPADGSIRVAVTPGNYGVVESKAPMNHNPDPNKQPCAAVSGAKCDLAFENVVIDAPSPWFPWDVNGDNSVSGLDFFAVLAHFNETKP
jgi:hypothetical protein